MAVLSRLESFDRDLAGALLSASQDLQMRVAQFAADWAVAHTGLTHPALLASSVEDVAALVAELDDRYFTLSKERDEGRASSDDVVTAFGLARAASAVEFLRRGEAAEAVYEAAASVEDWSELRTALLVRLG